MQKVGITMQELSAKTGISEFVLGSYVEGIRILKAPDLIDISNSLGIELNDLIGD